MTLQLFGAIIPVGDQVLVLAGGRCWPRSSRELANDCGDTGTAGGEFPRYCDAAFIAVAKGVLDGGCDIYGKGHSGD